MMVDLFNSFILVVLGFAPTFVAMEAGLENGRANRQTGAEKKALVWGSVECYCMNYNVSDSRLYNSRRAICFHCNLQTQDYLCPKH